MRIRRLVRLDDIGCCGFFVVSRQRRSRDATPDGRCENISSKRTIDESPEMMIDRSGANLKIAAQRSIIDAASASIMARY